MLHEHFDLFYSMMIGMIIIGLIIKFSIQTLIFRKVHGKGKASIGKYIMYKVREKETKINKERVVEEAK